MKTLLAEWLIRLGWGTAPHDPEWAALESRLRNASVRREIPPDLHEGIMARVAAAARPRRRAVEEQTEPTLRFPRLAYVGAVALCVFTLVFGWATRYAGTGVGLESVPTARFDQAGQLLGVPETLSSTAVAPLARELVFVQADVRKAAEYVVAVLQVSTPTHDDSATTPGEAQ
jgi:hypothetical protein